MRHVRKREEDGCGDKASESEVSSSDCSDGDPSYSDAGSESMVRAARAEPRKGSGGFEGRRSSESSGGGGASGSYDSGDYISDDDPERKKDVIGKKHMHLDEERQGRKRLQGWVKEARREASELLKDSQAAEALASLERREQESASCAPVLEVAPAAAALLPAGPPPVSSVLNLPGDDDPAGWLGALDGEDVRAMFCFLGCLFCLLLCGGGRACDAARGLRGCAPLIYLGCVCVQGPGVVPGESERACGQPPYRW